MHILVSNDDGIAAPGMLELSRALPRDWRVTIIAPDCERSASSHMLTINQRLYLKELPSELDNISCYSFSGSPTDCVKFALEYYLHDQMPDLIISGINNGYNLGSDALYSGTVSAAMEGVFFDIPALALSVRKYTTERGKEIIPFVVELIKKIFVQHEFNGFLNVNFPEDGPLVWSRLRAAVPGIQKYKNVISQEYDEAGQLYYCVRGEFDLSQVEPLTDVALIQDFITVTALSWNQLDTCKHGQLESILQSF